MLDAFSGPPLYQLYIRFLTGESIPTKIRNNPKFFPYFQDAIGAIDGSHIPVALPSSCCEQFHNCKGFLSQNALFICNFDLQFTYILSGWEGSATDACVYDDAISNDLQIPHGKYFLTGAGYPVQSQLLVPYQGVHYHLAEWGCANVR